MDVVGPNDLTWNEKYLSTLFVHIGPTRVAHLAAFHPSSRAGQGALLRFLLTL